MKKFIALTILISSFSLAQQKTNPEIEEPIRDLFLGMKSAGTI